MRAVAKVDPAYAFTSAPEKRPEMIEVAIALLAAARGRPQAHVDTLIDATSILLAAVRGEAADDAPAREPSISATGGGRRKKRRAAEQVKTPRKPRQQKATVATPPEHADAAALCDANGVHIAADGRTSFKGREIVLTGREAEFAAALARGMPNVMTYDVLAKRIWAKPLNETVKFNIYAVSSRVRARLAEIGLELKTVPKMGFALGIAE